MCHYRRQRPVLFLYYTIVNRPVNPGEYFSRCDEISLEVQSLLHIFLYYYTSHYNSHKNQMRYMPCSHESYLLYHESFFLFLRLIGLSLDFLFGGVLEFPIVSFDQKTISLSLLSHAHSISP